MITRHEELSINKWLKIAQIDGDAEATREEKSLTITAVLCGKDVDELLNLPYTEVAELTTKAGFILETAAGYRVGIDLYLSDCCARLVGFKRLLPYLYRPAELDLDLLVATHVHYDHFDPDAAPEMMKNPKTRLLCARDVPAEAKRLGVDPAVAAEDACKIEHDISDESFEAIKRFAK